MNSLFLVLIAVLAFAFGYRFYAKLLALGIFGLDNNKYSTPSDARSADRDYVPTNPYFLLGHHVAAIAAGGTVAGGVIALAWGWVPAFLWAVTGTAVAAGTYGVGSLWLSARRPGAGVFALAAEFVGRFAGYAVVGLALFVLLAMNATAAGLAARLLADHPAAVLPFWALAALALGFGIFLHGRREFELIPASGIALAAALAIVWLLSGIPIAFSGSANLQLAGTPLLAIHAPSIWVVLLFVYSFYAARAPLWKLSRPRGYLTTLLAIVALLIFFGGLALEHPALVAPEFHATENTPGVFPWLFVTLTSGALAGFHLLIANGISAKQLRRESHARIVGYGGALGDGVLALSAVLVAATAFADTPAWRAQYAAGALDAPRALALYLDGFVRFAGALELSPAAARTFGAVVLISLCTAMLEAGVRVLQHLLGELARSPAGVAAAPLQRDPALLHVAAWTGLLLALSDGRGLGGIALWPLFGGANLLLAGLGLLLLGLALRAARRPALLAFAPAAFALVVATGALVMQVIEWGGQGRWLYAALAVLLLGVELTVLIEAGRRGYARVTGVPAPPGA